MPSEQERQLPRFFEYQRKQRVLTIGRVLEAEAKAKADQVDYLLMRLSQGLLLFLLAATSWRSSDTMGSSPSRHQ